jgi:hypothetical protein
MIDGWFVLLVLSFVSSVGGLVQLLVAEMTARDGVDSRSCASSPRSASLGSRPFLQGVGDLTMRPLMVLLCAGVRAGDPPVAGPLFRQCRAARSLTDVGALAGVLAYGLDGMRPNDRHQLTRKDTP